MKKLLVLILTLIVVFSFVACGGNGTDVSNGGASSVESKDEPIDETEAINTAIENALKATVEVDYEGMEKYYDEPFVTKEGMEALGEAGKVVEMFMKKAQTKVTSCKQTSPEEARAIVAVAAVDFGKLVDRLTPKMMEKMQGLDMQSMTDEQLLEIQKQSLQLLEEELQGEVETTAKTITMTLKKIDGEWKVSDYEELYEELLGALEDAITYMI